MRVRCVLHSRVGTCFSLVILTGVYMLLAQVAAELQAQDERATRLREPEVQQAQQTAIQRTRQLAAEAEQDRAAFVRMRDRVEADVVAMVLREQRKAMKKTGEEKAKKKRTKKKKKKKKKKRRKKTKSQHGDSDDDEGEDADEDENDADADENEEDGDGQVNKWPFTSALSAAAADGVVRAAHTHSLPSFGVPGHGIGVATVVLVGLTVLPRALWMC